MRHHQSKHKLPQPKDCPDDVYFVLLACWRLDAAKRCSSSKLYSTMGSLFSDERDLQWPELMDAADDVSVPKTGIDLDSQANKVAFAALEVPRHSLLLGRELGKGNFGTVSAAQFLDKGKRIDVAVKSLKTSNVPDAEQRQFLYEARLLVAIQHPHVARVLGVVFASQPSMIVVELMAGDLKRHLRANKAALSRQVHVAVELQGVCEQVCSAMLYLAECRVVHRDLAARFVSVCVSESEPDAATCSWEQRGCRW